MPFEAFAGEDVLAPFAVALGAFEFPAGALALLQLERPRTDRSASAVTVNAAREGVQKSFL